MPYSSFTEFRASPPEAHDGSTVVNLIKQLRDESLVLVRQEMALARAETEDKLGRLMRHAVAMAAGGTLALLGGVVLSQAAAAGMAVLLISVGLSAKIASWLGPVLVGIILAGVGLAIFAGGKNKFSREGVLPEATLDSLRADKQWVSDKLKRHERSPTP